MANSQDVLDPNIAAYQLNGEQGTAWGGDPGKHWTQFYDKGFTRNGLFDDPSDMNAYRAAIEQAKQTGGRYADVNRYRSMGEAAMGRFAPTINYDPANGYLSQASGQLGSAQDGLAAGNESREYQLGALALQRGAAMGTAPSQAQLLGRNMLDQGLQSQLAGAASARGGSMAQAAAMRHALSGAAAYQQQGVNNLSALRAQEMATARDAYQAGATGIRGQDYYGAQVGGQIAGQYNQMGATAANMAQVRAQMNMDQRRLNQQDQQFYEQQAFNVNQAALNASMGMASNLQQQQQFNAQMDANERQQTNQLIAAGLGAGATMGAAGLMRRASGGPVPAGQPVLVGERGPEVIVPSQAGNVLPAHHPASQAAAKKVMSMADVAQLRKQADEIERGLRAQKAAGPAVRAEQPQAPVVVMAPTMAQAANYTPVAPPAGPQMSFQPAQVDMSMAPTPAAREQLMGGADDPFYRPKSVWGNELMGGRESPY